MYVYILVLSGRQYPLCIEIDILVATYMVPGECLTMIDLDSPVPYINNRNDDTGEKQGEPSDKPHVVVECGSK